MYKTLLFFYCCCFVFTTTAQNLLLNGDFEEFWECPTGNSNLSDCKYVFNPSKVSTPDYFNRCENSTTMSIPTNFIGFQESYSGNGYVGILNFESYREYVQIKISKPLIKNELYYFSFHANLSECSSYTTNQLGIKFVSDSVVYNKCLWEIMEADWVSNEFIEDTLNWSKLEGLYSAKGNENWMIIGCFYNDSLFPVIKNNNLCYSYDYIYLDYAYLSNASLTNNLVNIFTPNKDGMNDLWDLDILHSAFIEIFDINIYNRWGHIVFNSGKKFSGWDGNCNDQPCSEGVYFYVVKIKLNNNINSITGYITLLR